MPNLLEYPAVWPALLFAAVLPAWWWMRRIPRASAALRGWLPATAGAVCLALYAWCVGNYLCSIQFVDFYEPREASVACVLMRGGSLYPEPLARERYAGPYGPVLYVLLGLSQLLLGPSVFSTKLPCALAGLASLAGMWVITRRLGASRRQATVFAGLEAGMLLALRYASFWAKADPFILLCVTLGTVCALRWGTAWACALGVCAGMAVDLKPHALAYFLPVAVVAVQSGWTRRAFTLAGGVAVVTALLPFAVASRQISAPSYLAFLRVTGREGFGLTATLGYGRWVVLLVALVWIGDHLLIARGEGTLRAHRLRLVYRMALMIGIALVAVPGCAVGAGQVHLMAFIPAFLLAPADGFAGMGLVRPAGGSRRILWQAAAGSGLVACVLVAVQTSWRTYALQSGTGDELRACRAEIREFIAAHPDWTILSASGDGYNDLTTDFRHEMVFAGNPIGIDAAANMDYARGGVPETDLGGLLREVQTREGRPIVWLVPSGDQPFTDANIYDRQRPAHSEAFRRDFLARYALDGGSGRYFDLYLARVGAIADNREPVAGNP